MPLFDELMTKASISKRTEKELVSVKAERDEDRASRAKMAEQIANDATATKIGQRILDRAMNAKTCASTPLNQYYARAWAQCPKISAEALSMMAPLVMQQRRRNGNGQRRFKRESLLLWAGTLQRK